MSTHMESWSSTCWIAIRGAAEGIPEERDRFVRRYAAVVRAYLEARWKRNDRAHDIDDAIQEVFMECFREGGALGKADPGRPGGFRAFLFGVTRNVASRVEQRKARKREVAIDTAFGDAHADADSGDLAVVFDRAWAQSIMRQAWDLQEHTFAASDPGAAKRARLLRLRFEDGLPIREIAARWNEDAARLHQEYATARREFKRALRDVVSFHLPGASADVDTECARLLEALA